MSTYKTLIIAALIFLVLSVLSHAVIGKELIGGENCDVFSLRYCEFKDIILISVLWLSWLAALIIVISSYLSLRQLKMRRRVLDSEPNLDYIDQRKAICNIYLSPFGNFTIYKGDWMICDYVIHWSNGLSFRGLFYLRDEYNLTIGSDHMGSLTIQQDYKTSKWHASAVNPKGMEKEPEIRYYNNEENTQ